MKEEMKKYQMLYEITMQNIETLLQKEYINYCDFIVAYNICQLPDGAYKDGKKLNYKEINDLKTKWENGTRN